MTKSVFLTVSNNYPVDRIGWPITQGIPFADKTLRRDSNIFLFDSDGKQIPVQWRCLTTWSKDCLYVKWLLIDFQLDIKAFEQKTLELRYDTETEPNSNDTEFKSNPFYTKTMLINTETKLYPNEARINIKKERKKTCIDTGVMQVEIRHDSPNFFAACRIKSGDEWKNVLQEGKGLFLYMKDQYETWYDSCESAPIPVIEIEEEGQIRTSICVRGVYASRDGRIFCPYILRLHFFAGKAVIKVDNTFVFNQNPEKIELKAIGMKLPLNIGNNLRFAVGGEQGAYHRDKTTGGNMSLGANMLSEVKILQFSDDKYKIETDEIPVEEGAKTSGWCSQSGEKGSVTAVLYNMWQEYPKAFIMDESGIDIQIWPESFGENLKFSTPYKEDAVRFSREILKNRDEEEFKRRVQEKPTAPLNLKSLSAVTKEEILWVEEMIKKHAPDRIASYNDTGWENGYGAAKTTEIFLKFDDIEVSDRSNEEFAFGVQNPLIAVADLEYMSKTGALRYLAPICPELFPEPARVMEKLFIEVIEEPREKLRNYGMFNYGDLICSHSPTPAAIWHLFKDEGNINEMMKHCSKAYNNEANDQLYALWGFFLHTGNIECYRAAEAYGKHMADVDFYHEGPNRGLIHYHNAHHWTGGGAPCHSTIAGLMLQYYLTGNRRIFDVCKENAQWILERQEPCGIFKCRDGLLIREYTTPIANLLEIYQATWEYRYGILAYRSLKWMCKAFREPGCFPLVIRTGGLMGNEAFIKDNRWCLRQAGGMTPQMLYDAVELFGEDDTIFKDTLLGMANRYLFGPEPGEWSPMLVGPEKVSRMDPFNNVSLIAYAYRLTEDPVYAAYCNYYLTEWFPGFAEEIITRTELSRPGHFTSVCWGSLVPALVRAVKDAYEKYGICAINKEKEKYVEYITKEFKHADKTINTGSTNNNEFESVGIITI
ncbi:MAG TPA: hypothetical protein GXX37_09655 [Clostridiaceae bacterium]|nr:hypothetical protein [Clostridiaceae bacterium]